MSATLSMAEELMMRESFRVTMLRAAKILSQIDEDDVLTTQRSLLEQGCTLAQVAKIDRALIAEMHFRACAENLASGEKEEQRRSFMLRKLKNAVVPVDGGAA